MAGNPKIFIKGKPLEIGYSSKWGTLKKIYHHLPSIAKKWGAGRLREGGGKIEPIKLE
jgi:hypothetical protein